MVCGSDKNVVILFYPFEFTVEWLLEKSTLDLLWCFNKLSFCSTVYPWKKKVLLLCEYWNTSSLCGFFVDSTWKIHVLCTCWSLKNVNLDGTCSRGRSLKKIRWSLKSFKKSMFEWSLKKSTLGPWKIQVLASVGYWKNLCLVPLMILEKIKLCGTVDP